MGVAVNCADFQLAYQPGVMPYWLHISYRGTIEHMTWSDRLLCAIQHDLETLLLGTYVLRLSTRMGMLHLRVQPSTLPSRHRSGLLAILLLWLLSPAGPRSQVHLEEAKQQQFDLHPAFSPMDSNEGRVNNLIQTHLRGKNAHELDRRIEVIEPDTWHQHIMAKQARASPPSRASSVSKS